MRPVKRSEILDNDAFTAQRGRLQQQVLACKAARRVHLGKELTFLFENQLTVRWQVQEMCRVEGITSDAAIAHELETYNALLPGGSELSATLLIEIEDAFTRDVRLRELRGLHEHIALEIDGEEPAHAIFDTEQFNEARISSVQFVRIPLSESQRKAFMDLGRAATLVCTHPAGQARAQLTATARGALVEDLQTA